jgi:hypothetical protein
MNANVALDEYVEKAVLDFNNCPHAVLNGLTPIEVLQGKRYNKEIQNNLLCIAKQIRILENQKMKCCFGSF